MTQSNDPAAAPRERGAAPEPTAGGSTGLTAASLVLTGALFAGVVSTRGRFNQIFVDFKTDQTQLTNFVRSPPFAWLAGTLFGVTIAVEFALMRRKGRATFSTIAILFALLMAAVYLVGMLSPLLRLGNLSTR